MDKLNTVLYSEPWRAWLNAALLAGTAVLAALAGALWAVPLLGISAILQAADAVWWHRHESHFMDPPWDELPDAYRPQTRDPHI
jgi:hypothetical protein